MSMTGPGCAACDYDGRTTIDGAPLGPHELGAIPCGACSPWSHESTFPDDAVRAKAAAILAGTEAADPRMKAWAQRLIDHAAEVDADRAHEERTKAARTIDHAVLSYGSDNEGGVHLCLGDARIHLSGDAVHDLAAGLMAEASRPPSPAPGEHGR